ncbi:MAG: L-histidine N(alpha)-methyltransferase, partial [Balneolaceae bacterium]
IDTDFNIENYKHKAVWVEDKGAIEMRLYSKNDHSVKLNSHTFDLTEGEYLHTENSHKYTIEEFSNIVSPWFEIAKIWTDEKNLFSVQYLVPRDFSLFYSGPV